MAEAAFYAYAAPEPEGLQDRARGPAAAFYSPDPGEFLLKDEDVRRASSPRPRCSSSAQHLRRSRH